jgi:deoxyribose-phosphate aldolase
LSSVANDLAKLIDHSALATDTSRQTLEDACRSAREWVVASVCVMPYWVPLCARLLEGSPVLVGGAVGFPLGSQLIASKALEARLVIERGAGEVDFVMNVGAVKSGDWGTAETDAREVIESVRAMEEEKGRRVLCKMILECCCLTDDEKRRACEMAQALGVDFVKTSTGFGDGGATVEDVQLMRGVVRDEIGVKAAGAIRTLDDAQRMIQAGATRIGTSSTAAILGVSAASTGLRDVQ